MPLLNRLIKLLLVTLVSQLWDIPTASAEARLVKIGLEKVQWSTEPQIRYVINVHIGHYRLQHSRMLIDLNAPRCLLIKAKDKNDIPSNIRYTSDRGYRVDQSWDCKKCDAATYVHPFMTSGPSGVYKVVELFGPLYSDKFKFIDVILSPKDVQISLQCVVASARTKDDLETVRAGGILDLGSAAYDTSTPIRFYNNELVDEMQFGLLLNQDRSEASGGDLTLGGFDSNKYQGDLRFHALADTTNSWKLKVESVKFGNEVIACSEEECLALLSTTTNEIHGPTEAIKKVLKFFGFSDIDTSFDPKLSYAVDCSFVDAAPSLTFVIDGSPYAIGPKSYIFEDAQSGDEAMCLIGLRADTSSQNKWILGTNFLSNFYSAFDIEKRRVAFAPLAVY